MLKETLIFVGGAVLGAACMYLGIKKRYENHAQNEINEIRQMYLEKCRRVDDIRKLEEEKDKLKDVIVKNKSALVIETTQKYGYASRDEYDDLEEDDFEDYEVEIEAPVEHPDEPYTITPNQFACENRHYDKVSLLYYPSEEVLINELYDYPDGEEDVNATIGKDNLTKFGEFEEDVVYVRNDRLGIDYEVILQPESEHYIFGDGSD